MYVHLTEEAKEICKANYRTNCGKCPLRPVCVSGGNSHLTVEKLDDETIKINELATEISKEEK
jgi:hypothetical protein